MLGIEDFKQTRWGQELLAEGRQEGEEVGLAKGLAKSRQEGKELGFAEGLAKGLAKGRQAIRFINEKTGCLEGKLKLVPALLDLRFTFEEVAELLKVETEQVRQLAEPEKPE